MYILEHWTEIFAKNSSKYIRNALEGGIAPEIYIRFFHQSSQYGPLTNKISLRYSITKLENLFSVKKKLQYSTTMLSYVHSTVQFTVDKQLRNLKQIVQGVNLVYAAWRSRNVLSKQNGVGLRGLPVPTINMHESYTWL